MSKNYSMQLSMQLKSINTEVPDSWGFETYWEMLSTASHVRHKQSQPYVRSPLSRRSSFVHPGLLSPHAWSVFHIRGLKPEASGLEINPVSDLEAFPGSDYELRVIGMMDKKSPRSPLAPKFPESKSPESKSPETFISPGLGDAKRRPVHKSLLQIQIDSSHQEEDDKSMAGLTTGQAAEGDSRESARKKIAGSASGSFFSPEDGRNIWPVLLTRRSSMTSSLSKLARKEQGESSVNEFLSTPELPKESRGLGGGEVLLMRSPSAPTVGAPTDQRLGRSFLRTMRSQVQAILKAERGLHPDSPDALMVDLDLLQKKAEHLALALAKSEDPGSADYLDWLFTAFKSPDVWLKEVRQLALKQEMARQRVAIFDQLARSLSTFDSAQTSDVITLTLDARLDLVREGLSREISQETYSNLFMFSDLTGDGESLPMVQAQISQAADRLVDEVRAELVGIERRYVTQLALSHSAESAAAFSYNELDSKEPEASQGPLNFYQWHLNNAREKASEKFEQIVRPVDLQAPAVRFIEETAHHKAMASGLFTLAGTLGVSVSERDILEMHRLVVSPRTAQPIVLRSQYASDDSSQALSIIDTALAAEGYSSPVSAIDSLDGIDLSEETVAPNPIVRADALLEDALSEDALSEDALEESSGKSLLHLAMEAENYPAAFVMRAHEVDFSQLDRDGHFAKLNMIRISKKKVEAALSAYEQNRAHLVLSQNYQTLQMLLDQAGAIRMGELMKVFLVNEGGMGRDSMKTLLAHHLNIPGIHLGLSADDFPGEASAKRLIGKWCQEMIFLKLGVKAQGFEESTGLLNSLIGHALENIEQPENQEMLSALFSMSAFKVITRGDHTDKKLATSLKEKFGAYLSSDQSGLKAGPKTEVRQSLDQVLEAYKSKHRFSSLKSNYRSALKLKKSERSLSENLPLGDLLAIFHSKSGEFAAHSFKRLLAKELAIPGFESDQSYKDQKQALRLVDDWARKLLIKQILGDLASEAPPGERNPLELPSQRLLNLMMDKAFGYFKDFNGAPKAREIFNGLAILDTLDIQAGFKDDQRMDQEISRLLQAQISKRSGFKAQEVRQPALARAFSASRKWGHSDAASEILAQHIQQESPPAFAA